MNKFTLNDREPRAWLLLCFGDERKHAGNDGYADQVSKIYEYDSLVSNSRQITEGDFVVLRNKEQLIGIARIKNITSYQWEKPLSRCPACGTTKINKRITKKPVFRCIMCGKEFETSIIKPKACKKFIADFGNTFIAAEKAVKIEELRQACPKYNGQLSINCIDLQQIKGMLLKNAPEVAKLLNVSEDFDYLEDFYYLKDHDAEKDHMSEYVPTKEDSRQIVFRQIKERRGQSQFRNALCQRYGDQCMISGCNLLDILEAAHISPYRGADDNHLDNGLLLRGDLHTLFDLDLLGIHPDSLEVELHPKIIASSYQEFEGKKLIFIELKPSRSALEVRWRLFCRQKSQR